METAIAYTMLALMIAQGVLFFVSVSNWLTLKQGGHKSAAWKSPLWGGYGFLVMCINGLLASHYLSDGATMTALCSLGMGAMGFVLIWLGRQQRAQLTKNE